MKHKFSKRNRPLPVKDWWDTRFARGGSFWVQEKQSFSMHFSFFLVLLALSLLMIAGCSSPNPTNFSQPVTIFKSESCGCCSAYTNYMQKSGFTVSVSEVPSMAPIKTQFSIPESMQSCHTTRIGNYFVEGHIPVEAIDKLLAEKPDIAGIAMPGMPSGSPGMPGSKEPFIIYAIGTDGSITEFMKM